MLDNKLPHDEDAEKFVISVLLQFPDKAPVILDLLQDDDFYREKYRLIFNACRIIYYEGNAIDAVSVATKLKESAYIEEVGGVSGLLALAGVAPSGENVKYYCEIIRQKSIARKAIKIFGIAIQAINENGKGDEIIAKAQLALLKLLDRSKVGFQKLSDYTSKVLDRIETVYREDVSALGIRSGFVDLDKILGCFENGSMIVIAARPSMGKSTFAKEVLRRVAKNGSPGAVFSLEDSKESFLIRLIASEFGVSGQKLRIGDITENQISKIAKGINRIVDLPIFIDDSAGLNVENIRIRARRLVMEHKVKLFVCDYLQLLDGEGGENRNEQVRRISWALKQTAKELNVPFLVLSQLSRACEQRQDKRPRLSDLRDSGAIEQDADVVIFLYRDHVYNPESPKEELEVIVAKHRNGPLGICMLHFDQEHNRIGDWVANEIVREF